MRNTLGCVGGVLALLAVTVPVTGVVTVVAAIVTWLARRAGPAGQPWQESFYAVIVVGPAIVFPLAARLDAMRSAVRPAAVLVAAAVVALEVLHFRLDAPIVDTPLGSVTRTISFFVSGRDLGRVVIATGVPALAIVVLRRQKLLVTPPGLSIALAVSIGAILLALPRLSEPSPAHYLGSLEPAVPIVDHRSFVLGGNTYTIEHVEHAVLPEPWDVDGGRLEGCVLDGPNGRLPLGNLFHLLDECRLGWDPTSTVFTHAVPAVYVDRRGDYAVLYQPESTGPYLTRTFARVAPETAPTLCDGCSTYALALRVSDGAHVRLDTRTLSDRLSAPGLMIVLATLGSGSAIFFALLAHHLRRTSTGGASAEAIHDGGGTVRLADDTVHVAAAAALPTGPVVLFDEAAGTDGVAGAYRVGRYFAGARAGTLAELRERAATRVRPLEIAAFALATLTAAPLLGAHLAGL